MQQTLQRKQIDFLPFAYNNWTYDSIFYYNLFSNLKIGSLIALERSASHQSKN